jgi:Islet cell autoantigen ICA69, C-terminal domain
LSQKNQEVLEAHLKIAENEPKRSNFIIHKEFNLINGDENSLNLSDKDQQLFFSGEFSDVAQAVDKRKKNSDDVETPELISHETAKEQKLIDYENFDEFISASNNLLPSQLLIDDLFLSKNININANSDLLGSLSALEQDAKETFAVKDTNKLDASPSKLMPTNKNPSKKASDVTKWFHLFSDLDPLNQQIEVNDANNNMHAA